MFVFVMITFLKHTHTPPETQIPLQPTYLHGAGPTHTHREKKEAEECMGFGSYDAVG